MNSISFELTPEVKGSPDYYYRGLWARMNGDAELLLNVVRNPTDEDNNEYDYTDALTAIHSFLLSRGRIVRQKGPIDPLTVISILEETKSQYSINSIPAPSIDAQIFRSEHIGFILLGTSNNPTQNFGYLFHYEEDLNEWIERAKKVDPSAIFSYEDI